jgi:hypothetical protein
MQNFDVNVGTLVAADTQGTLKALDDAILSELKLCTTLVEAIQGGDVPIASSQKILSSVTSGLSHIVAGRGEMATAVRQLTILKRDSNLSVYDYGCPNGALSVATEPAVEPVSV